MMIIPEKRRPH